MFTVDVKQQYNAYDIHSNAIVCVPLITATKRKLRWFAHVSRSSGLAKTILQGTVKGKRKRGRQKNRWEDNIKEWTGMDFASSTRAAENRKQVKMEREFCKFICGAPTTFQGHGIE